MRSERRNAIALDDAYFYCRHLETGGEKPDLFKLCNALHTLDYALDAHDQSPLPLTLCVPAWTRVRDGLFNILLSSFAGYVFVYDELETLVEPGADWPANGLIEFFPDRMNRTNEGYRASFAQLDREVLMPIRWAFAEGRQQIGAADFGKQTEPANDANAEVGEALALLQRLNEVCEEQASEGKKHAHRKWWQLYWEANGCPDKREKNMLEKQMVALQSVWGTPDL